MSFRIFLNSQMSAASHKKQLAENFGLHGWQFRQCCGATPSFPWAGTCISVNSAVVPSDMHAWWRAAQRVMGQLAEAHPILCEWWRQVQMQEFASEGIGPLIAGWAALQAAFGMPAYPMQVDAAGKSPPVGMLLYSACPYEAFVQQGVQLTGIWLQWSHAAWQQGSLDVRKEDLRRWLDAFGNLRSRLPSTQLIALHHRLWERGISWQWPGKEQTVIGEGERQRVLEGVPEGTEHDLGDLRDSLHVPIYTVTGSVGKTTTARLLWSLLQGSGRCIALAASDGAWIGDQCVAEGDCIGGVSARALLRNPSVQAAVFEQGRGGLLKQGLPYARSDMGILLNVQAVHLGLDGIGTPAQMADVKSTGIRPARLAILNHDDAQCRRIGSQRDPATCIWFSATATAGELQEISASAHATVGVLRNDRLEPDALTIWQGGESRDQIGLEGVAPYHGMLGEKTLEELLAAVAAAWFGPLPLDDWPSRLRALRLDHENHVFRTSVHRQGRVTFVLDKAGEAASMQSLQQAVEQLAQIEGCRYRIAAVARSAGEHPDRHRESALHLHGFMDEFICFDRADSYLLPTALPLYRPGAIPQLLKDEFERLNAGHGITKPVTTVENWEQAESLLRARLSELDGKILVLINQPSTSAVDLNRRILAFASSGLPPSLVSEPRA